MNKQAIFLDFDGVLCDSLPECYETSLAAWLDYSRAGDAEEDLQEPKRLELFRRYRPFIRNGGDYLFLQRAISRNHPLQSQEEFDQLCREDPELNRDGDRLFQEYRARFLSRQRQRWFSLNPLFPGVAEMLKAVLERPEVYILSTKPARFIGEILTFHSLLWPEERIICSKPREKGEIILEMIQEAPYTRAIFVEDQVDHLMKAKHPKIRPFLAEWGYIREEWKHEEGITPISIEKLQNLIGENHV